MPSATLTFTVEGDTLDINIEFDPPISDDEKSPASHVACMIAFNAVTKEYGMDAGVDDAV